MDSPNSPFCCTLYSPWTPRICKPGATAIAVDKHRWGRQLCYGALNNAIIYASKSKPPTPTLLAETQCHHLIPNIMSLTSTVVPFGFAPPSFHHYPPSPASRIGYRILEVSWGGDAHTYQTGQTRQESHSLSHEVLSHASWCSWI